MSDLLDVPLCWDFNKWTSLIFLDFKYHHHLPYLRRNDEKDRHKFLGQHRWTKSLHRTFAFEIKKSTESVTCFLCKMRQGAKLIVKLTVGIATPSWLKKRPQQIQIPYLFGSQRLIFRWITKTAATSRRVEPFCPWFSGKMALLVKETRSFFLHPGVLIPSKVSWKPNNPKSSFKGPDFFWNLHFRAPLRKGPFSTKIGAYNTNAQKGDTMFFRDSPRVEP